MRKCYWIPCYLCRIRPYFSVEGENCVAGECLEGLQCWYVPIPSHLMEFDPLPDLESNNKSFLGLGKLCEYLMQYTRILQRKGKQFYVYRRCKISRHFPKPKPEGIYDKSLLEKFLQSLKNIQTYCITVSRDSLENLLSPKIPSTAVGIVFKKLFVDWESFEASCKFEHYDESKQKILKFMCCALAQLYTSLQKADMSSPYCDKRDHNYVNLAGFYRLSKDHIKEVTDLMSNINSLVLERDIRDLENSSKYLIPF